jgi:hypothetical protein
VTCWAARRERTSKPRAERSAIGSSRCHMRSSSSNAFSVTDSSSSWCSQPKVLATRRASASSFASSSRNPKANVITGRLDASAISATIKLKSTPPESIAPSGTSLMSRSRTAARRSSRSSSAYSSMGRGCGSGFGSGYVQYSSSRTSPASIVRTEPGASLRTPKTGVLGPGTKPRLRLRSIASRSSSGSTNPARRCRSSHAAIPNFPRSRSGKRAPSRSYRCGKISVSHRLANTCPSRPSSRRRSAR